LSFKIDSFPDERFEVMGKPSPGQPFGLIDYYRFHLVCRQLVPGSVLDVGAYFGDFLQIAREDGHEISGTEVNSARVEVANSELAENAVVLDFRNGCFKSFRDAATDNVVCMEVVEHVPDDGLAVSELCRVARNKVFITVPFRERIQSVLCVHCNKLTPYSGHLHTYDYGSFSQLVPSGWKVTKELPFAKRITRILASNLPNCKASISVLGFVDSLLPIKSARWLMVVIEPSK